MTNPPTPRLWWDPGALRSERPMTEEGPVQGSPFGSFVGALAAADARRSSQSGASPIDNVFLITPAPDGWWVFEYAERRLGKADLAELSAKGLPLGGSVDEPRTHLVDAHGRVGRLTQDAAPGEYVITEVDRDDLGEPAVPDPFVPAIVPAPVVNQGGNVKWEPRVSLRPGPDIEILAGALRSLDESLPPGVAMRAGGWRHSWSPVAATEGVYIHPELMRGVEPLAPEGLFRVLSGTRIREVNSVLWKAGYAIPWLGGYDGQTLGGVLPTGTHGSVLRYGPLAEMVRGLDLVRFDGRVVRLEPASKPLTPPDAFRAARPTHELVQNDETFRAALLGLGSMGVVMSLDIEAEPRFWLKEVRTRTTMAEAVEVLRGGNIYHLMECEARPGWIGPRDGRGFPDHPKPSYHLELLFNAYTDNVLVTSRHRLCGAEREKFINDEPDWFADAPVREFARALKLDAMADDYSRPDLTELATEHLGGVLDDVIEVIARARPQMLPGLIDGSINGLVDPGYTQRSYKVFNIGQGANSIPAQSGTFSVPLRDDLWLRAIEIVRATAKRLANEGRRYQTGPIALRFVRGSRIPLADPEDVAKFEVIFGGDTEHVKRLSREVLKAHGDALHPALGSDLRWHWGQIVPEGALGDRVRESYPGYDEWRGIRDSLDPSGRGLNAWLRRNLP